MCNLGPMRALWTVWGIAGRTKRGIIWGLSLSMETRHETVGLKVSGDARVL